MDIPENELAWMAGFVDGEGCISLYEEVNKNGNTYFSRRVRVVNTRLDALEIFHKYFGGSIYKTPQKDNNKEKYCWNCSHSNSDEFIGSIIPYLKIKKLQAELYMDYDYLLKYDKRNILAKSYLAKTFKKLNRVGVQCPLE